MVSSRLQARATLFALAAGLLLLLSATQGAAQTATTLVQTRNAAAQIELGYPPPQPVDSVLPVAGFRRYASLHARHQDLALRSPDLRGQVLGQTGKGRDIWAYVLGDTDDQTRSGALEPVLLLNGTIHAREWQSPEVATGILERFIEASADSGLVRFLLDEIQLVVIPVLNVDGFVLTQAHPQSTYLGQDPEHPETPREGRLRRKNLRDADELYQTTADHLFGVDLNRNFPPYFGTNNRSSPDRRSLIHRGPFALSEPESQALLAAADQIGPGRLRLYADLHSFSQVLFTVRTGQPRTDILTTQIASRFARHHQAISRSERFPAGRFYPESPDVAGSGTGYTSEYFASRFLVPSWTLEIEPGENGAQDYGAPGWHHDGFILPDSEVERVRTQLAESHLLLAYHVAGPASLLQLKLFDADSGVLVASSVWSTRPDGNRVRSEQVYSSLAAGGRYRLWLGFDRPMRVFDAAGQATLLPGQDGELAPRVRAAAGNSSLAVNVRNGQWIDRPLDAAARFDRYRGDAWTAELELPASSGPLQFQVDAVDAIGRALDADPATAVDWQNGAWAGYQDGLGQDRDVGGPDRSHSLATAPPVLRFAVAGDQPVRLGEGESLRLRLLAAAAPLQQPQDMALVYSDGLQGPASLALATDGAILMLRSADNLQLDGSRDASVQARLADGSEATLVLQIVDNDSDQERVLLAHDTDTLLTALGPEVATLNRRVRLLPGQDYQLPPGRDGNSVPEVQGVLRIEGQNARLLIPDGARAFDVAAGATLEIEQLRLDGGGAATLDGGQLRSLGTLRVRGLDSHNARGRCGGAVLSRGVLEIERSSVREAQALQGGAVCVLSGSARIANSTLLSNRAEDGAAIFSRGQTVAEHITLSGQRSSAGAQLAAPAGQLQLVASVFGPVDGASCSGSVLRSGSNLGLLRVCEGPPDASDVVVAASPLLPATDPRWLMLAADAPALPTGSQCSGSDQRNGLRNGGRPCDFGALERALLPQSGLWWNPQRSGEGLDIQRAGDGLLVLLYSYEANGEPITYTAQGLLLDGVFSAPLLRWRRAAVSLEPEPANAGSLRLLFATSGTAAMQILLDGQPAAATGIEVFRFGPETAPQSGRVDLAYGGNTRYGASWADHGGIQVALVYAYAADQVLRWALADNSQPGPALQLTSFIGACPACDYRTPTGVSAGSVQFRGMGLAQAQMDLQLRLGVGSGGTVLLESAPLARID